MGLAEWRDKNMSKLYNEKINLEDPLAQAKYLNIESLRYLSNEIGNLKKLCTLKSI